MLEYEVIWGHIDILVVAVRRLSRRWKVKTLLAGPSPTSPVRRRLPTPLFPTHQSAIKDQAVVDFRRIRVTITMTKLNKSAKNCRAELTSHCVQI